MIRIATLAFALFACASCGGSSKGSVTSPFSPEDEALFDGSVEFVEDPAKLSGRWRDDWEREIGARAARADVVFVGVLKTARQGGDSKGRAFVDLGFEVEKTLKGKIDASVDLRSRADHPGHRTLGRAGDRVLGGRFVAFVKWIEEDGVVRGRFHLAHASDIVLSAVEFQLSKP